MDIIVRISGTTVGQSLNRLWSDSLDMRSAETKYTQDVLPFITELLDELEDPDLDRMIIEHIRQRLSR